MVCTVQLRKVGHRMFQWHSMSTQKIYAEQRTAFASGFPIHYLWAFPHYQNVQQLLLLSGGIL